MEEPRLTFLETQGLQEPDNTESDWRFVVRGEARYGPHMVTIHKPVFRYAPPETPANLLDDHGFLGMRPRYRKTSA